jgi:hypothetical protein
MAKKTKKIRSIVFRADFELPVEIPIVEVSVTPEPVAPPAIFTKVERELIMADIAFLKQKEIESGDWAKWQESQRPYTQYVELRDYMDQQPSRVSRPGRIIPNVTVRVDPQSQIMYQRFCEAVGRPPQLDELDRASCAAAGTVGHWQCGWCDEHNKPRFICGCLNRG